MSCTLPLPVCGLCSDIMCIFAISDGLMVWCCGRYKLGVSSYFEAAFFFRGKLFEMDFFFTSISGQVPYAALGGQEIVRKLRRGERLPKPDGCSDEMYVVFIKTRISFVFSYLR